jgi:serine/threonine protein kinase
MLELVGCGGGAQIKREISTMKMVKHPNIVQLLEVSNQQLLSLSLGFLLHSCQTAAGFFFRFLNGVPKSADLLHKYLNL